MNTIHPWYYFKSDLITKGFLLQRWENCPSHLAHHPLRQQLAATVPWPQIMWWFNPPSPTLNTEYQAGRQRVQFAAPNYCYYYHLELVEPSFGAHLKKFKCIRNCTLTVNSPDTDILFEVFFTTPFTTSSHSKSSGLSASTSRLQLTSRSPSLRLSVPCFSNRSTQSESGREPLIAACDEKLVSFKDPFWANISKTGLIGSSKETKVIEGTTILLHYFRYPPSFFKCAHLKTFVPLTEKVTVVLFPDWWYISSTVTVYEQWNL